MSLAGMSAPPQLQQKLTYLALHHQTDLIREIDTVRAYSFGADTWLVGTGWGGSGRAVLGGKGRRASEGQRVSSGCRAGAREAGLEYEALGLGAT